MRLREEDLRSVVGTCPLIASGSRDLWEAEKKGGEKITNSVRVFYCPFGQGKSELFSNVAAPPHMVPYVIGMGKDAHAT